ncbi:MAG TPA: hypothetical protein VGI30_12005, partial [Caulobacteraceae bacterium]
MRILAPFPQANGASAHIFRMSFYAVISYWFMYYSYKYYVPDYGCNDFYHYYNIYIHPFQIHAGSAPFV